MTYNTQRLDYTQMVYVVRGATGTHTVYKLAHARKIVDVSRKYHMGATIEVRECAWVSGQMFGRVVGTHAFAADEYIVRG